MKTNSYFVYWMLPVFVLLFGAFPVRAESDLNELTNKLQTGGLGGITSLIEAGGDEAPLISSGDNSESDQAELLFGRSLLHHINLTAANGGDDIHKTITHLLIIGEWIQKEEAYGNLVISHRAFDVAGSLTLKAIGAAVPPSEKIIVLAKSVAESRIEPSYRALVLDKELSTQIFSKQLASIELEDREQAIRKLWKNFCFLAYFETNPTSTRELDRAKQSILMSLGDQANAVISLGKSVPQRVLTPQSLQFTSTDLLEARNLWFVSMASAPGNIGEVASVFVYLTKANQLPKTSAGDSREMMEQVFLHHWSSFDVNGNPTIAKRVANIVHRVRSGAPLDRDSNIGYRKIP